MLGVTWFFSFLIVNFSHKSSYVLHVTAFKYIFFDDKSSSRFVFGDSSIVLNFCHKSTYVLYVTAFKYNFFDNKSSSRFVFGDSSIVLNFATSPLMFYMSLFSSIYFLTIYLIQDLFLVILALGWLRIRNVRLCGRSYLMSFGLGFFGS